MPHLNEGQRRIVAGNVAMSLGRGGITAVAEVAGMSRSTVQVAVAQIDAGTEVTDGVRAKGAGGKPVLEAQPGLLQALDDLVEPESRGCRPTCALRWTAKSTRKLADELVAQGYSVSHAVVGQLLWRLGCSLQALAKTKEGASHPDRDVQFAHLAGQVNEHTEAGQPVISVGTTKKLRHEVARSERARRSEVRPIPVRSSGPRARRPGPTLDVRGHCSSSGGVRSSGESQRTPAPSRGCGSTFPCQFELGDRRLLIEQFRQEGRVQAHPSTWGASLTRCSSAPVLKW
jgi:hypothetical protein